MAPGIRDLVRASLADALALVLPVECAGCGVPDVSLCEECAASLAPRVFRVDTGGLATWAALPFEGPSARVVRSLKEDGRTGLARALAPALRAAVDDCAGEEPARAGILADAGVLIVPVPTSRAAFRRRGFRVVELVARRAGLRPARLLRLARVAADQRGLARDERRRNVAGSMRAADAAGRRVIVIDDVVTTGATLAEGARALRAGGAEVLGAAVIAATPLRSRAGDTRRTAT